MLTIGPVGSAAWVRVRPVIRVAGEADTRGRLVRLTNRVAEPTGFCIARIGWSAGLLVGAGLRFVQFMPIGRENCFLETMRRITRRLFTRFRSYFTQKATAPGAWPSIDESYQYFFIASIFMATVTFKIGDVVCLNHSGFFQHRNDMANFGFIHINSPIL